MSIPDDSTTDPGELSERSVELARHLLERSLAVASAGERRRQRRTGRLLESTTGREMLFGFTDEVMRIDDAAVASRRFRALATSAGAGALGPIDRVLLVSGSAIAQLLPRLVMPVVRRRIRAETRGIVLPARDPAFARFVQRRTHDGVRLNVNPLGEAVLSEAEAEQRRAIVVDRLDRPDVNYVSVKVSALVANLDPLAFDHSVEAAHHALREVLRVAMAKNPPAFVNLDMEEYKDLEVTLAAFIGVLSEDEFRSLDAGIALQAYLPDSHDALQRLGRWATERRRDGGGRIKVRVVKGANLAMERVEAELNGWVPAPYPTKAESDASFKAMVDAALAPEWADGVRVGIATHNLFDVAWGLLLAEERRSIDRVDFEMLEGMAPAQARAVAELVQSPVMYTPVVAKRDFSAAIAYLARRLDENTQPDNFLRALFHLTPDSAEFARQADNFRRALRGAGSVPTRRRRYPLPGSAERPSRSFRNEANTDVTDPVVRDAVLSALRSGPARAVAIDATTVAATRVEHLADVDRTVDSARRAFAAQPLASTDDRRRSLEAVARVMSSERFETIGVMAADASKTAHESDHEISEAIDFCRYYGSVGCDDIDARRAAGLDVDGRGVVVVVAPWNFPCAIPTGGVAAALAAGNAVILKPAPETVVTGALVAEQFWRAGVPRDLLQLLVCDDGSIGRHLVTHPGVDTVVLTGAYDTAERFLEWRPDMRLFAETSGKNAIVVTAAADLDLAITDLVSSAFGHAGQKCSAASLAFVERSIYERSNFLDRLRDAVTSLRLGAPTEPATMMAPLIAAPSDHLRRGLTVLDPGERWLVEPRQFDESGRGWSPGVRIDVASGSWFQRTECFGPVLGISCVDGLDEAIGMQNSIPYGLTGGIHSLDRHEVDEWLHRVEVGNAYVNRHITGAVVQRQPFGGWKRSSVGGGAKAGGPHYVRQFTRISESARTYERAADSYERAWRDRFVREHDPTGLLAERNVLRYRPLDRVAVRHDGSDPLALELLRRASATTGIDLRESDARLETERQLLASVRFFDRLRILCPIGDALRAECHRRNVPIDDSPPVCDGEVELARWMKEQSISETRHRHGRIAAT
jgi:RHH-type transcriptional regulator, proline utilization regulon repressor / proline dehydrogenase / delta 1-pyrroline-5-carboxylate dehydrogenase